MMIQQIQSLTNMTDSTELFNAIDIGQTYYEYQKQQKQSSSSPPDRFWCLDPIDGTKGFLRGLEGQYCIALALLEKGIPTIGILACPNLPPSSNNVNESTGCIFVAVKGHGCYEIGMSPQTKHFQRLGYNEDSKLYEDPTKARFCIGVEQGFNDPDGITIDMGKILHGSLDGNGEIQHVTRMDSQVKYGVIARGESEFYVRLPKSHKDNIWDVAAGVVCLEEVGGKVTDTTGKPLDFTAGPNLPTVGILGARTEKLHQSLSQAYQQVITNKSKNDQPQVQQQQSDMLLLKDCVCLVTGASRGIGRGIAMELGAQGATVYLTGTSTSGDLTVEETARKVNQAGGVGIPIICDHADDAQVQALINKIEQDHGKLDILVNNAFQIPPGAPQSLMKPFWEQGSEAYDILMNVGLRSHFVATCKAIPLLRQSRSSNLARPLVVMISSFGGLSYTFNTPYGIAKAALDRMAKDMSFELGDSMCVTSVSFSTHMRHGAVMPSLPVIVKG